MANISIEHVDDEHPKELKGTARKRLRRPRGQQLVTVLLVLAVAGAIGYMLFDRMRLSNEIDKLSQGQSQQPSAEDEAKQLANEVSKLIELPKDETPTIATVTDASKVKDKPFFANAQNGDKVLLYAKSSKAVLYRPSTQKLIEVSALNLSEAQPTGTTTDNNSNR